MDHVSSAPTTLGHLGLLHPFEGMATFGTDWWYVAGTVALIAAAAAALHRLGHDPGRVRDRHVRRIASGAARLTGLPDWAAGMVLTLLAFLPVLALGFFWDVAWHVDIGRDEYLLSPPHVLLALGVGPGFALAGAMGVVVATRTRADVAWRWRSLHVPVSAAFLLLATGVAGAGWIVDELWHMAYGLDVTMWSPPHMGMIGSAFLLGGGAWLLLAEARTDARPTPAGRLVIVLVAGATLVAFSSVQLEFDLGVAQWQLRFQPLLIAMAAGVVLPAARTLLGRGGALAAVGVFLAIRLALAAAVDLVWHFSVPRAPLYLAAAVAVELLWRRTDDGWRRVALVGTGIATAGLAGEWAWSLVDGRYLGLVHPWGTGMLPALAVALPVAVASTALGVALGRLAVGRALRMRTGHAVLALAVIALGLGWAAPRQPPAEAVAVRTAPAGSGLVDVTLHPDDPTVHRAAERLEVFAWQGGTDPVQTDGAGRRNIPLVDRGDGSWAAAEPVPVGGSWKTMVILNSGSAFGALPISLPADPEYGLAAVPVAAERRAPYDDVQSVLLREAVGDGSAWVAALAYGVLALGLGGQLLVLARGAAALDRRRRRPGQRPAAPVVRRRALIGSP